MNYIENIRKFDFTQERGYQDRLLRLVYNGADYEERFKPEVWAGAGLGAVDIYDTVAKVIYEFKAESVDLDKPQKHAKQYTDMTPVQQALHYARGIEAVKVVVSNKNLWRVYAVYGEQATFLDECDIRTARQYEFDSFCERMFRVPMESFVVKAPAKREEEAEQPALVHITDGEQPSEKKYKRGTVRKALLEALNDACSKFGVEAVANVASCRKSYCRPIFYTEQGKAAEQALHPNTRYGWTNIHGMWVDVFWGSDTVQVILDSLNKGFGTDYKIA